MKYNHVQNQEMRDNNALHRRCVICRFLNLGLHPHLGERGRYADGVGLAVVASCCVDWLTVQLTISALAWMQTSISANIRCAVFSFPS